MSYADRPDLLDAYDSFQEVTDDLDYECERVTHATAGDRILPDILERIRRAAFVIVDLTELRPNVLYELGYADGLGKRVVVTAKKGRSFHSTSRTCRRSSRDGQRQLKQDLRSRILEVAPSAVPSASPPIGRS